MHLSSLALTNFRCFRTLELDLPCAPIVVTGRNAQGKSSLLEALYVLSTTRAAHATTERELIHWDAGGDGPPFARVRGRVVRGDATDLVEIVAQVQGEGGTTRLAKRVRVNHSPRKAIDAVGLLNVVLFTPRDLELVDGGPAHRRRFLDVLRCQIDPEYCRALSRYHRILTQRNHLLRLLRDRGGDRSELDFWDVGLAAEAGLVLERRAATVAGLHDLACALHGELTSSSAMLRVRYRSDLTDHGDGDVDSGLTAAADRRDLERRVAAALAARRHGDIARGATSVGPHRDDILLDVDGMDVRVYGSRGQQRTVALALKLAEVESMRRITGERPVLLLDDVLSELDGHRREMVLANVAPDQQTLLTATEPPDGGRTGFAATLTLTVESGAVTAKAG